MALLDMSDVITDPDLSEPATSGALQLVRIAQTVGSDGIAVNAETVFPLGGVVCSTGGRIARDDMGEVASDFFTLHTLTPLTAGRRPNVPADIVVWQGARYTVTAVNDFSNFGPGFYAADCSLLSVQGEAL